MIEFLSTNADVLGALLPLIAVAMIAFGLPAGLSILTVAIVGILAFRPGELAVAIVAMDFSAPVSGYVFFGIAAMVFFGQCCTRAFFAREGRAGTLHPIGTFFALSAGAAGQGGGSFPTGRPTAIITELVGMGMSPAGATISVYAALANTFLLAGSTAIVALAIATEQSISELFGSTAVAALLVTLGLAGAVFSSSLRSANERSRESIGIVVGAFAAASYAYVIWATAVSGTMTPTEAFSIVAFIAMTLILAFSRPLLSTIFDTLKGTGATVADIALRLIAVGIMARAMALTGAPQFFESVIETSPFLNDLHYACFLLAVFFVTLIVDGLSVILIATLFFPVIYSDVSGNHNVNGVEVLFVVAGAQLVPVLFGVPRVLRFGVVGESSPLLGSIVGFGTVLLCVVLVRLGLLPVWQ